jgi:hypothetical protein
MSLTGEASRWPTDDEFRRQWIDGTAYPGRLDAAKLRTIYLGLQFGAKRGLALVCAVGRTSVVTPIERVAAQFSN